MRGRRTKERRGKTEGGRKNDSGNKCYPLLNMSLLFDICRELECIEKRRDREKNRNSKR